MTGGIPGKGRGGGGPSGSDGGGLVTSTRSKLPGGGREKIEAALFCGRCALPSDTLCGPRLTTDGWELGRPSLRCKVFKVEIARTE